MYYSTGISPNLKYRGFAVDCSEPTAKILIAKGYLVSSLEELFPKKVEEIEEELPEVISPVVIINENALGRCVPTKEERQPKPVKSINVADMIAKSKKKK
jgi:hypothetical protein